MEGSPTVSDELWLEAPRMLAPAESGLTSHALLFSLDIGGKLLTNLLKETLSFRQWDMMDETCLVSAIKERCCFIAQRAGSRQRRGAKIDLDGVLAKSANEWTHAEMAELSK
jgi:actin-related protein